MVEKEQALTTTAQLERRMTALEEQFRAFKDGVVTSEPSGSREEFLRNMGFFTGDPDFKEVVRLGRKWREAHRPRAKRSGKAKRSK
jgi:hypothetical protein